MAGKKKSKRIMGSSQQGKSGFLRHVIEQVPSSTIIDPHADLIESVKKAQTTRGKKPKK